MGKNCGIHWLNSFDVQIELFLNQFVGRHPWFDEMVYLCAATALAATILILLFLWNVLSDSDHPTRMGKGFELLLGSAFFSMLATLAARGLAFSLPFRARPIATPMLHFRPPAGGVLALIHWSAFPSDHATLFFSLAAGLLLVSRPVGWFAIAWVTLFICLPLLYLGAHWSTDILAGAVLGVSFTQMARIPAIREFVRRMATKWHHKHPILFLAGLILWCYETAVLFEDVRRLLVSVAHFI